MRKLIIALVVASASLVPGLASSQATATAATTVNDLQADAPTEYTVQKGDTLWAISGKFLKEPWKWPQIWQMNRDQIKNPHLIYPGDIIRLDRMGDAASLSLIAGGAIAEGNVVRLQPRTRIEPLQHRGPDHPGQRPGPFLTQPLIRNAGEIDSSASSARKRTSDRRRGQPGLHDDARGRPDAADSGAGEALTDPETGDKSDLRRRCQGEALRRAQHGRDDPRQAGDQPGRPAHAGPRVDLPVLRPHARTADSGAILSWRHGFRPVLDRDDQPRLARRHGSRPRTRPCAKATSPTARVPEGCCSVRTCSPTGWNLSDDVTPTPS